MVFYVSHDTVLEPFVPGGDALDRNVMSAADLITRYHWDKRVLSAVLSAARTRGSN